MKNLNYILIISGAVLAFYGESESGKSTFLLISGIALLMIGVYRISKTIPSKNDEEHDSKENE